jgi:hypothetical protein
MDTDNIITGGGFRDNGRGPEPAGKFPGVFKIPRKQPTNTIAVVTFGFVAKPVKSGDRDRDRVQVLEFGIIHFAALRSGSGRFSFTVPFRAGQAITVHLFPR